MRRALIVSSLCALAACGGGTTTVAPTPTVADADTATRARWSDNMQRISELKQAVAACATKQQGSLGAPCDSLGHLTASGFLPSGYTVYGPYLAPLSTYSGGVITLVGTPAAGNCAVTLVPSVTNDGTQWSVANKDATCRREKTGVD